MRDHDRHTRRLRVSQRGLTLLELLIVVAIIGIALYALSSSLRILGGFGLSEDSDELAAMLRRASQLAIERGEQHRVVFDLEKGGYRIDVCQGQAALARNEAIDPDKEKVEEALKKGQDKLRDVPQDALAVGDPDEAMKRAKALAGHHIGDRMCAPAMGGESGVHHSMNKKNLQIGDDDADWIRALNRSVKFSEIWVQHKDSSTKKGEVALYFFPNGSAEKAVIEMTDGDGYRTLIVNGLTGRIQQKTGRLEDVEAVMLRNVMGKREKERETDK
jgi:prepilin-type N-terminal cleavage/methylation domain-containing protein